MLKNTKPRIQRKPKLVRGVLDFCKHAMELQVSHSGLAPLENLTNIDDEIALQTFAEEFLSNERISQNPSRFSNIQEFILS